MVHQRPALDWCIVWLISLLIGLTPILFLPLTQDYYETNKWLLLILVALVLFAIRVIQVFGEKTIRGSMLPAFLGFGAISIASLITTLLSSTNAAEAIAAPYGPAVWIALSIIVFIGGSVVDEKRARLLQWVLTASAAIVSVVSVYQYFGVFAVWFPSLSILSDRLWTPVGSSMGFVGLVFIAIPVALQQFIRSLRLRDDIGMTASAIVAVCLLSAISLTFLQIIPRYSEAMLSLADGWTITASGLRNMRTALVGFGAENFLFAFTTGRPAALNATPLWNIRFLTNASTLLHIVSVYGLIGLAAGIMLLRAIVTSPIHMSTRAVAMIVLLFLPPSTTVLVATAAVLMVDNANRREWIYRIPASWQWVRYLFLATASILIFISLYALARFAIGEFSFYQALNLRISGDGTGSYKRSIAAIQANPYMARYHTQLADTSLAIASAITAQTTDPGTGAPRTLSDTDRDTATSLIQQAIRESKLGIKYAANSVIAWERLAQVYQNLIGVAQNSHQWAITGYQKAIQLDPTNPFMRLRLGSVHFTIGDFAKASEYFTQAVSLKPDYANAHYNLGNSLRQERKHLPAAIAFKQTLALINPGASDHDRIVTELTEIKNHLTEKELEALEAFQPVQKGSAFLQPPLGTSPSSLPNPNVLPTISLPE